MGKSKKDSRQTVLFDIRPRSEDKDVILLKGPESEAASVLFSGAIVVSVLEPLTIKKFSLKLFATLKLNWEDKHTTSRGHEYIIPTNFTKILYDFEWDCINLHEFLQTKGSASLLSRSFGGPGSVGKSNSFQASSPGFTTGKVTRSNPSSSTSLQSLANNSNRPSTTNLAKNKSSSNLSSLNLSALTSSSKSDTITLQPGNYEFPFQAFLDGSIPESIEGLPGCSIVYRLQSIIERGRFSTPLVTRRHIHVVRTLTTDAPDLSESVAVDNTWPKKVDYSITVPTRSIAIGSRCNIEFTLVPLLKDLRLGNVKVRLVEYSSYVASTSQHSDERIVLSKTVSKVNVDSEGKNIWKESEMDINGVFFKNEELELAQDKWEIRTFLDIPASLGKITQDCDISKYVKVRHKLKFSVGLINPDGHVSELRATLPISLFISPFVPIQAKHLDDFEDIYSKYSNIEDLSVRYKGEEMIFENDSMRAIVSNSRQHSSTQINTEISSNNMNNDNTQTNADSNNNSSLVNTQDLMAPPNYENHVYDRVFTDASPLGSPLVSSAASPNISGAATPLSDGSVADSNEVLGEFNMTPSETGLGGKFASQLISNLSLAARASGSESPLMRVRNSRPVFSLMGDDTTGTSHSDAGADYFSIRPHGNGNESTPATPSATNITSKVIAGPSFNTGVPMAHAPSGSNVNLPALMSPGTLSPIHLSRVNSYSNEGTSSPGLLSSSSPLTSTWNGGVLSKVPSYETAMKDSIASEDLTPAYQPPKNNYSSSLPSSGINLDLLNSRLEKVQLKARASNSSSNFFSTSQTENINNIEISSLHRTGPSSSTLLNREQIQLTTGLARSRGSSNNSSPAMSRNQSSANLPIMRSVPASVLSQHLQQHQQQSKSVPISQPQTSSASSSTSATIISASNSVGNGSSVGSPSVPRPVHARTLSGSSAINLPRSSSVKSLKSSHKAKLNGLSTGNRTKEGLRSSGSSLHVHLNLPKKSGSFANLSFLHSTNKDKGKSNGNENGK